MVKMKKTIINNLLEEINIEDLCIATGRRKAIDKETGFEESFDEPVYRFSPTLAAKTFLKVLNLDIKPYDHVIGVHVNGEWIYRDYFVVPIIKTVIYEIAGDLPKEKDLKTMMKLIMNQIRTNRETDNEFTN